MTRCRCEGLKSLHGSGSESCAIGSVCGRRIGMLEQRTFRAGPHPIVTRPLLVRRPIDRDANTSPYSHIENFD